MGLSFTKLFSRLFAKQEMRILMVGLDAAGKTTILSPPFLLSGSMWRLLSIKTLVSLCGMSGVMIRSVLCGGITSKTSRVLSLWWTVMTETVLLKLEMNCTGC